MFIYGYPVNYGRVRAGLSNHMARKSALQHAFCDYSRNSMGLFASFVMHAFYKSGTNVRFHVMQFFEAQLHAVYGLFPGACSADKKVVTRLKFVHPGFQPCNCLVKADVTGLPCRCGCTQVSI